MKLEESEKMGPGLTKVSSTVLNDSANLGAIKEELKAC